VAEGRGATVRLAFEGTDVQLRARTGPRAGLVHLTVDGRPVPGLRRDAGGSYVSLGNSEVVDDDLTLASGLPAGEHLLELRAPDDGSLALGGITVGRRQPFDWAAPLLLAVGLAGLAAGLLGALRAAAVAAGWIPRRTPGPRHRRDLPWWDTRE
jgi:hypothetical protein